ncbi:peroxiredoxin family protein [Spirosoma aerolatum]|uniref:peroxiredoxin family protein n=1 Tax=Spirosoma aerolatum TaxID=1211326 RepID=UPI0009AD8C63|nr:redoxin domain-containing protein [Spirosoma aerolatum]
MRTYLKWGLPLLVLSVLSYLIWGFTNKLNQKQKTAKQIQTLPTFTAYGLDSSVINTVELRNRSTVFIYFDPDCEHCQREADELHKRATLLNNAQIILLSSASLPALRTFAQIHQLTKLSNVQVAHIDRKAAYETFGFTSIPDILIYHTDGSLAKHFRGETSIEAIARHL